MEAAPSVNTERRADWKPAPPRPTARPKVLRTLNLADVEPEPVRWLWYPYIPAGKLTLIEGDPGIGKSWISCAIAKAVANGEPLPGQEGKVQAPPQRVLLCSAEDNPADTIVPRLRAMNADLHLIDFVDQAFTLNPEGIAQLEETMREFAATIVFIDPIVAYLGGKVDMNQANEVRDIMTPLAKAAEHTGCAIVAVRHLRKAGGNNTLYRGIGSIDFTAAVRSVMAVTYARDGRTKLIRHIKHNITPAGATLAFDIDPGEEQPDGTWTVGTFQWGTIFEEDEYGPGETVNRTPKKVAKAQEWLISKLNQGPVPALEILHAAEANGFSKSVLKRAKHGIAISDKELNQWVWRLALPGETPTVEEEGV